MTSCHALRMATRFLSGFNWGSGVLFNLFWLICLCLKWNYVNVMSVCVYAVSPPWWTPRVWFPMYVCMYIFMYACMQYHLLGELLAYDFHCMYVCMYLYMYMYMYMYVCMYVCSDVILAYDLNWMYVCMLVSLVKSSRIISTVWYVCIYRHARARGVAKHSYSICAVIIWLVTSSIVGWMSVGFWLWLRHK
jgi:hypothetical protein